MAARMLRKLTAAALVLGASFGLASQAVARPKPGVRVARPTPTRRTFSLFAGAPQANYRPNRVQCGIINNGTACTDPSGSPVNENGFWPAGSPDNYVFNSGLQIAGFIPSNAGFAWAGDTVGAFFFDPRGDQHHGEGLTNIYDQRNPDDVANWPTAGDITDTALFATTLLGRHTASQEDLWYRYWDGNTALQAGRKHSMGLLVDQRFMGWNYPAGNNDILYTLVRFINITSANRTDYDNLSQYGYSTADIDAIYQVALNWRATSQAFYNVTIPAGGFSWSNVFASYAGDFDEGDAGHNFSMGNLIFNTVVNYKSNFDEPTWQLPPSIFSAPFLAGPGMAAIKYLQTPGNLGLSMAGNTTNTAPGVQFPDAVGIPQLWRHLSGELIAADGVVCDIPGGNSAALARHQCYWAVASTDTRIYGSSGPFTVAPGQAAETAVALVFAASVAKLPLATAGIAGHADLPASDVQSIQGNDFPPTHTSGSVYAVDGTRLLANQDTVAPIDRTMGFVNYTADLNANGKIDQSEVITVPRSLLDKEKVAQTVYDNKFLLPFAPEAPSFFLVPGDGEVTVVWQKSLSETSGNPFYAVASQPLINGAPNALYDPNFRRFDVEGYRIWRGRSSSEMAVIAQFDYAGTTMLDYTAEFYDEVVYGNACAPELGVTTTCPAGTTYSLAADSATYVADVPIAIPLSGIVRQVPPGGRVELANGTVFNISVDTAVTGGASGYPPLSDNGVPFAMVDNAVINGVRYFYAVTAFSINSLKSGPSSLESPLVPKTATPRAGSGAETKGTATFTLTGRGTTALDPTAPMPAIDPNTGNFAGPVPPTNGINITFAAFVPFVPNGAVSIHIDSITASDQEIFLVGLDQPGTYYTTVTTPAGTIHPTLSYEMSATNGDASQLVNYQFPPVNMVNSLAGRFGGDSTFTLSATAVLDFTAGNWQLAGVGRGAANGFPDGGSGPYNGPVMWTGATPPANPNGNNGPLSSSLNKGANVGDSTGGLVAGVSRLWHISDYLTTGRPSREFTPLLSSVFRAADFNIYWGATAGKVDSVIDVTHNVVVPFSRNIMASWGILNDSSFTNTPASAIPDTSVNTMTWTDAVCVYPATAYLQLLANSCGGLSEAQSAFFMDHALANPINYHSSNGSDLGAANAGRPLAAQGATGTGFLFYLAGSFWVVQATTNLAGCCQNTVWHMRSVAGSVTGAPGSFGFVGAVRPPAVPGLTASMVFTGSSFNATASVDSLMSKIHTVPDPYYVTNSLEQTVNTKILRFVNLPAEAIVRIYSSSGVLVRILTHNDAGGGGEEVWDLRNRNNQFVASGVYFYHVEAPDGKTKVGRFTVVDFAQ